MAFAIWRIEHSHWARLCAGGSLLFVRATTTSAKENSSNAFTTAASSGPSFVQVIWGVLGSCQQYIGYIYGHKLSQYLVSTLITTMIIWKFAAFAARKTCVAFRERAMRIANASQTNFLPDLMASKSYALAARALLTSSLS